MTRLYLPSTGTPPISPALHSEWDSTATLQARLTAVVTRINSPVASTSFADTGLVLNSDLPLYQFLYALPTGIAFTTSHVIWGQMRCVEGANAANFRCQFIARVLDSAGTTTRAVLYAGDLATLSGNPPNEWTAFLTNRQMPRGTNVPVAVNYTSVAGDWLVLEFGYRRHSTSSATARCEVGDDDATDLPLDESTQSSFNPWVEFTTDLVTPPAAPARRRMMMIS